MAGFGYDDNDIHVLPLNGSAVYASLTIGTSAVEAKVGGSALANRSIIIIQPLTDDVWIGFNNSVTTSTGMQIFKKQTFELEVSADISVYLIADGSGRDVRILEIAQTI